MPAFFTYSQTTSNYVTTGTLTAVVNPATGVAVTAGDCPAGRVLRETGRKLYATAAYPGVSTYMVSVYDSVSTALFTPTRRCLRFTMWTSPISLMRIWTSRRR
jgi:hypothetical protein